MCKNVELRGILASLVDRFLAVGGWVWLVMRKEGRIRGLWKKWVGELGGIKGCRRRVDWTAGGVKYENGNGLW